MSVKWISHRGESIDAPENTLAAFLLARERRTDGMECDVMFSADGVVMVSHDATTARMGNKVLSIPGSSCAELTQVDVSGVFADQYEGERMPTLSQALECVGDRQEFFIELKDSNPEIVPAVRKVLEEKRMKPERIVIIARDPQLIACSKRELPAIRALWLPGPQRQYTHEELISELKAMHADGVSASGSNEHLVSSELVCKLHELGFIAAIAVIEHPEQARRIADMGFDYITSSRAAKLRFMLARRQDA